MSLKHPHLPTAQRSRCTGIPRARGQGMIEFALLLPLLILFVFGAADLGRAFQALIAVTNATREGARQGIYNYADFDATDPDGTTSEILIKNAVINEAKEVYSIKINLSDVTVTCGDPPSSNFNAIDCTTGKSLNVKACYNFQLITRIIPGFSDILICRDTKMRIP